MWEENPCAMLIRRIHLGLEKESDRALKNCGLTLSQATALLYLEAAQNQELSLKELERRMQVSQPCVVGIVNRLEKKKLLLGFQDALDKRVKLVQLTPEGKQYCQGAKERMAALEQSLLHNLTADEQHTLRCLLEKICKE